MHLSKEIIDNYDQLITKIESKNKRLEIEHKDNMLCKKGCSSCCIPFRIVPVEKFIIHHKLLEQGIATDYKSKKDKCRFLENGECSIYDFRPIMCRTHGFPLLYLNENETAYEFSSCDLNFTDFDLDEISEGNSIMMDDHIYTLNQINIDFLESNPQLKDIAGEIIDW